MTKVPFSLKVNASVELLIGKQEETVEAGCCWAALWELSHISLDN